MEAEEAVLGDVRVENVGGIDETRVTFRPGVTVLVGPNATNRTSFLTAVMFALGSDRASLRAGAEAGVVEYDIAGTSGRRTLERKNGTVVTGGEAFLSDRDDVELAELFAFLLESNEARRTVATGGNIRDLVLRPVDVDAIENEIEELLREKDQIDEQLAELESLEDELPALTERKRDLQADVDALESELEAKRTALEERRQAEPVGPGPSSELQNALDDLEAVRAEYNRVRQRLERERRSVTSLEAERDELRARRERLPDEAGLDELESRLDRLRARKDRLDRTYAEIQRVVEFNERMLDGDRDGVRAELVDDASAKPASGLLPASDTGLVCWTCGSTVERDRIEDTVDRLRGIRQDTTAERTAVTDEIEDLSETLERRREAREDVARVETRLERTASELAERRDRIDDLEADRDRLEARIADLESRIKTLQTDEHAELLELNNAINDLEFERDELEHDLATVTREIEDVESRLATRDELADRRSRCADRLSDLRGSVERTERELVDAFNERMDELLGVLAYANVERIWMERRAEGDDTRFELNVVREADEAVHADEIANLSESEREVTGLVFALAGYLVHEVHETVPVMILDSLEAIDAERIAALLEYFDRHVGSILVALLPEDAAAVDDAYEYVTEI